MKWILGWLVFNLAVVLVLRYRKQRPPDLVSHEWLIQFRQGERETVRRGE